MTTETSSIDDLLSGSATQMQPETPENQYLNNDESNSSQTSHDDYDQDSSGYDTKSSLDDDSSDNDESSNVDDTDEYGSQKEKGRMYTEEEKNEAVNKAIRERVKQFNRNHPENAQSNEQTQQMAQDFSKQYDANSEASWEQQLESFIENTYKKINLRESQKIQQEREQAAALEFRDRFEQGMNRYSDFMDVVSNQPVTDYMAQAMRGIKDPAAFIYAASKNHAQELQRISNLQDPYAQIVEMGRLEERMRKKAASTQAPRPVSRTTEDSTYKQKPKEQDGDSIESLIAKAEARKIAKIKQLRGQR